MHLLLNEILQEAKLLSEPVFAILSSLLSIDLMVMFGFCLLEMYPKPFLRPGPSCGHSWFPVTFNCSTPHQHMSFILYKDGSASIQRQFLGKSGIPVQPTSDHFGGHWWWRGITAAAITTLRSGRSPVTLWNRGDRSGLGKCRWRWYCPWDNGQEGCQWRGRVAPSKSHQECAQDSACM